MTKIRERWIVIISWCKCYTDPEWSMAARSAQRYANHSERYDERLTRALGSNTSLRDLTHTSLLDRTHNVNHKVRSHNYLGEKLHSMLAGLWRLLDPNCGFGYEWHLLPHQEHQSLAGELVIAVSVRHKHLHLLCSFPFACILFQLLDHHASLKTSESNLTVPTFAAYSGTWRRYAPL